MSHRYLAAFTNASLWQAVTALCVKPFSLYYAVLSLRYAVSYLIMCTFHGVILLYYLVLSSYHSDIPEEDLALHSFHSIMYFCHLVMSTFYLDMGSFHSVIGSLNMLSLFGYALI